MDPFAPRNTKDGVYAPNYTDDALKDIYTGSYYALSDEDLNRATRCRALRSGRGPASRR